VKRVLILASLDWICAAPAADFREFDWGSSIAAIRSTEKAWPVFAADSLLEYQTDYAGRPMSLLYRFAAGRLEGGSYHFAPFRQCGGSAAAPPPTSATSAAGTISAAARCASGRDRTRP
jgi:hypothetical protein